jgi:hypothetical protein
MLQMNMLQMNVLQMTIVLRCSHENCVDIHETEFKLIAHL